MFKSFPFLLFISCSVVADMFTKASFIVPLNDDSILFEFQGFLSKNRDLLVGGRRCVLGQLLNGLVARDAGMVGELLGPTKGLNTWPDGIFGFNSPFNAAWLSEKTTTRWPFSSCLSLCSPTNSMAISVPLSSAV